MGSRLEANSSAVRKRIEKHRFDDEEGEEYEPSKFGGFNEYFRRKKIKLQNLDAEKRSASANNPLIFRGVVAHVNGYTQPSLNDLHSLIVSYGGGFMQYLDGKTTVTHIIASNLTPKKKVEFSKYRIVKPAWIVDSIKAGRLLPWDAYRVVDKGVGQRVLGFENGNIISQVNNSYGGYRDQTDTSWYTAQVKGIADELSSRCPESPFPSTQALQKPNEPREDYDYSQDDTGNASHESSSPDPLHGQGLDATLPMAKQPHVRSPSDQDLLLETSSFEPEEPESQTAKISSSKAGSEQRFAVQDVRDKISDSKEAYFREGANADHVDETALSTLPQPSLRDSNTPNKPSAEEHNAMLLADPRVRKSTVVNPAFLKQYYEESRLHHLSSWKADLKSKLQKLAAEKTSSQRTREKRPPGSRRYILHVDFDSFFAAVSLRKYPQYVDKPVVVAHGGGSGSEIASCNYPARKFGVKNGMWMKHAQKMCTDLKVLPYDFPAYEDASRNFYEAIMETGGLVQSVSVDEALVDVSVQCVAAGGHDGKGINEGSIWREQAKADEIAMNLRDNIKGKTGCAVSVGIGGNILLAKVALRKAKPAGQYHIKPEEVLEFLGGLTVQELPGVAYSIGGKLEEIGVMFVKDVRELSKERMITTLGPKTGEKIWDYSRGIDRTEVGEQVIRKSVSAEVNWGIRFVTQDQAEEFIQSLCEELHKRLITEQVKGRQLTMKIMRRAADAPLDPPKHLGHGKCDTFNKSLILGVATNDQEIISREAISILRGFGFSPGEFRGLGVQMQRLEPLKGSSETPFDSSQKKLQFKASSPPKPRLPTEHPAIEDIDSPQKPKVPPGPHPAAAFANEASPSGKPRTPLNILGTQFVMPTQVDAEVLQELPQDIRSKLLPKQVNAGIGQREDTPAERSRSGTPNLPADAIPSHSQLDKETLDALPADVRAEILAFYHKSPNKAVARTAQALLPQSPRKGRSIKFPKKLTTPTKRRTGLFARTNKNSAAGLSTLTQSNFVANARPTSSSSKASTEDIPGDIPDDFLAALPDDIRREVLAQQRRDRLQKKGGIDFSTSNKRKRPPNNVHHHVGQRTLTLPPCPPKPTFTSQKFCQLPELRKAICAWFDEFREEGPYADDVDALVKYLHRVVVEEGNMDKAVSVGKWMAWVVDEGAEGVRHGAWRDAVSKTQLGVQKAIKERGLGEVEF
ncbi:deoxycytidyl transferase [Lecanora helva]